MRTIETIIVGGGIAGLACARRLYDNGRPFLLITDRLGGRMHAAGPSRNFGATYITSDYRYSGRYVARGRRIGFGEVYFRDGDRPATVFHPRNLRRLRAIARLYRELAVFRRHLDRLRAQAPFVCQAELLDRDPLLSRTVEEPVGAFIQRHGLEEIDEVFTNPIVSSTVFAGSHEVNTFYYLACLMPLLLPTWLADLSRTVPALTAGFEATILTGRVTHLEESRRGWIVATNNDEFQATNVVVATPCHNTRTFCPALDCAASDGVREIPICSLHVLGRRRREYRPGRIVFLRPGEASSVLLPLDPSGGDLLFTKTAEPDLSPFYEEYRITDAVRWKTAIVLSGHQWRPLAPRPNLYTIGDYNICGLEDSFLTGLFAANSILARSRRSPKSVQVPAGIDRIAGQVSVET